MDFESELDCLPKHIREMVYYYLRINAPQLQLDITEGYNFFQLKHNTGILLCRQCYQQSPGNWSSLYLSPNYPRIMNDKVDLIGKNILGFDCDYCLCRVSI